MKIQFIGVGSAFTTADYYQSNLLITAANGRQLLLDCGSDTRLALTDCGHVANDLARDLDAVYISHLHADHVGGMEWLARVPRPAPLPLYAEHALLHQMWRETLQAGLDRREGKHMHLTDYFACHPLQVGEPFRWQELHLEIARMPHIINTYQNHHSYGLWLREGDGPRVFITTDTVFERKRAEAYGAAADLVFHDCETSPCKTGVHAHYEELRQLSPACRAKIWLYHYQPNPDFDAVGDGFRGFVQRGQAFSW